MSAKGDEVSRGAPGTDVDELLEEARALVMYVARRGDEVGVSARQREFEDLVAAIVEVEVEAPTARAVGDLQVAYGQLTALTYTARQVNGRTLIDTKGGKTFLATVKRHRPLWLGLALFAVALWLTAGGVPESLESVRPMLLSALWGGLGSCVFLAKRISDRLAEMAYEDARMRGDVIRVFLGAMLAVVAVGLFFPEFDAGEVTLTDRLDGLAEQVQSVQEDVADLAPARPSGAGTPGGGEQTPGGGEQTPGGGEQTPDGGEQTPDGGEQTPDDGEQTPDDGEQTSDDGEETSDDGEETSDDGEQTSDGGEQTSDGGEQTSDGGDQTPEPYGVGPATLAFLVGLTVKPFYAALESLSEALAKRFRAGGN